MVLTLEDLGNSEGKADEHKSTWINIMQCSELALGVGSMQHGTVGIPGKAID